MGKRRREDWGFGERDPQQYARWARRRDEDRERRVARRGQRLVERAREVASAAGQRSAAELPCSGAPGPAVMDNNECRALGVPLGTERAGAVELAGSLVQVRAARAAATDARLGRRSVPRSRVRRQLPPRKKIQKVRKQDCPEVRARLAAEDAAFCDRHYGPMPEDPTMQPLVARRAARLRAQAIEVHKEMCEVAVASGAARTDTEHQSATARSYAVRTKLHRIQRAISVARIDHGGYLALEEALQEERDSGPIEEAPLTGVGAIVSGAAPHSSSGPEVMGSAVVRAASGGATTGGALIGAVPPVAGIRAEVAPGSSSPGREVPSALVAQLFRAQAEAEMRLALALLAESLLDGSATQGDVDDARVLLEGLGQA